MTAAIESERWWGSALLAVAREAVRRRQRDDVCRRERRLTGVIVAQARYLHGLCGTWPTAIATPYPAPSIPHVRLAERYKPSGRFAADDAPMLARSRVIDIKVDELRNSDGFWAAEIPGRADPVLFWPAPKEPPEWWEAR
jgi:hypothetical protein